MFLPIGDQPNPRGIPFINYLLIAINVGVFLLLTLPLSNQTVDINDPFVRQYMRDLIAANPGIDTQLLLSKALRATSAYDIFLLRWGYRPAEGSLTTLITSMFLHGGWMHLLGNMLFLWIYGDNVEHRLGRIGYLLAYLGTGVIAAAGYGLLVPSNAAHIPMVGASGAISGVLGFYFIWFPRNKVRVFVALFPFFFDIWLINARWVLGFYLIVENLLPFLMRGNSAKGGVAYGAHIGGFLGGLLGAILIDRIASALARRKGLAPPSTPPAEDPPASATNGARSVEQGSSAYVEMLVERGEYQRAAAAYLSLSSLPRRRVAVETTVALARALTAQRQPDVGLAVLRRAIGDHGTGPDFGPLAAAIGFTLLYGKDRPTAAYQYLMDALDASISPELEAQTRAALDEIARRQKLQIKRH